MENLLFINLGTAEIFILIVMGFFTLLPLIFAIGALWDLQKRDFTYKSTDKVLIILLILFAPFIGTLVYILLIRNNYPPKIRMT
ncbi:MULTISPECIES: PLDc N-terminal domain-containing protein [Sphingobacterium]|uniref:PLDc N-terminal domain-containing protein n=1 Tax=Sphingobacterium litopenaei TaxID=2763500 RepID=A0ABR7YAG6_9SPHI|nr:MULTISPECIES: PLDc N-terminal domain-containing protein [Sphingobacterium]MBD1428284.1 PLDc N-terminal domain-containing protein [Sphingobacterium litopenaei]NGM72149.1 hypothetical protein [Sphingobacterium sp. SGL-16]